MEGEYPGLFEAFGVELEYMVVDAQSLNVRPIVDQLLTQVAGELVSEFDGGLVSWSNELALHVVEFKTTDPARSLEALASGFQEQIARANELLANWQCRLLPTGMHPWMDPYQELQLWPHDYNPVYEAYHRIFDCRGHGWANLQSVHLNLPFRDDEEFGRLHAAIRLILPILPALTASSPLVQGQLTSVLDNRLEFYRHNSARVASVTAGVVPEPVFSRAAYEREILQRMYREIAPLDPAATLQYEWLNSRGAIARFDRQTIEIRVMDVQEAPIMDLAIVQLVVDVLRRLVAEQWTSRTEQGQVDQRGLEELFVRTAHAGQRAPLTDANYVRQFGLASPPATVGELWGALVETCGGQSGNIPGADRSAYEVLLERGSLAERIRNAVSAGEDQRDIYRELADCLALGRMFRG